ncbi:hypothetical protein JCM11641_006426 [Rhodosporidiobolus odoratus]
MLTRTATTSSRACRCASTSFAPPCRHSRPSSTTSTSTSTSEPVNYAAPLYPSSTQPGTGKWFRPLKTGWAGWTRPPTSAAPPAFPPPPTAPAPEPASSPAPRPTRLRDKERDHLPLLTSYLSHRGPRSAFQAFSDPQYTSLLNLADKGDMPLLKAMVQEDLQLEDTTGRTRYRLGMDRFTDGGKRTAEEGGLGQRVVVAQVGIKDCEVEAKKREEEEKGRLGAAEKAGEVEATGNAVQAALPEEAAVDVAGPGLPLLPLGVALSNLRSLVLQPRSAPLPLPEAFLANLSLPTTATPHLALTHLWRSFSLSPSVGLATSPCDLLLALRFLHYLSVTPIPSPSPSAPTLHLPLAMEILKTLLSFLPSSLVAPSPSAPASADLPNEARVQALLLQTLVNISLAESRHNPPAAVVDLELASLAAESFLSLATLKKSYPALAVDPAAPVTSADNDKVSEATLDRSLLLTTLGTLLAALTEESARSYRPSSLASSSSSSSTSTSRSSFDLATSLLKLLHTSTSSSSSASSSFPQHLDPDLDFFESVEPLLDSYANEATLRYRWDSLASVWSLYNPPSPPPSHSQQQQQQQQQQQKDGSKWGWRWELKTGHLKLARWLAGEAPFSTYPSLLVSTSSSSSSSSLMGSASHDRPIRRELFYRFAHATTEQLCSVFSRGRGRGRGGVGQDWTSEDKNEWIEGLVGWRGSTRGTRRLGRLIAGRWLGLGLGTGNEGEGGKMITEATRKKVGGGGKSVRLRSSTVLALVRTAVQDGDAAAGGGGAGMGRSFAQKILTNHIQQLVTPTSPFFSPSPSSSASSSSSSPSSSASPTSSSASAPSAFISHFDLTTLATAYSLLSDWTSVAQVYKRVLQEKMLPDAKDVEEILAGAPRRGGGDRGLGLVRDAHRVGVKVGEKVWRRVLRGALEGEVEGRRNAAAQLEGVGEGEERGEGKRRSSAFTTDKQMEERRRKIIEEVLRAAEEMGLGEKELERLKRDGEAFLPLRSRMSPTISPPPPTAAATASPTHLLSLLRYHSTTSFTHSLRLYNRLFPSLLPDSIEPLDLILTSGETALLQLRSMGNKGRDRERFKAGLRDIFGGVVRRLEEGQGRGHGEAEEFARALTGAGAGRGRRREVLDRLIRIFIRVDGEVDEVDRLFDALSTRHDYDHDYDYNLHDSEDGRQGLVVREATVEQVVRWAIGKEGKTKVMAGQGWVGARARERRTRRSRARLHQEEEEEEKVDS